MHIFTTEQLLFLIIQFFLYGFSGFVLLLLLLKVSPAWPFFKAWISRHTIILMKKQNGTWSAINTKYNKGLLLSNGYIFQPITDGTDIGSLKGVALGVTSEYFGATISPEKIGALELWKKYGISGVWEAELFDYYLKKGDLPKEDYELSPEVKVRDLYETMQKVYNFRNPIEETLQRFKDLEKKIPEGEYDENGKSNRVFYIKGKGLFVKIHEIVDYNTVRNFQMQYLRPDLVEAQLKAHVQARIEESGSAINAVKYAGIGLMILLALVGVGILLKMLNIF